MSESEKRLEAMKQEFPEHAYLCIDLADAYFLLDKIVKKVDALLTKQAHIKEQE